MDVNSDRIRLLPCATAALDVGKTMATYTAADGTVGLTVSRHPRSGSCHWWVTYTKVPAFFPAVAGETVAKFASPGDAFDFASFIVDSIDRGRTARLEEVRP